MKEKRRERRREIERDRDRKNEIEREVDGCNKVLGKYKKRTKRKEIVRELAKE